MRRIVAASLTVLACIVGSGAQAADLVLYFKRGLLLSSEPPARSSPGDEGTATLVRRHGARLASFVSAPLLADIAAQEVSASLFLVARRTPLEACAVLTVTLLRVDAADRAEPVATASFPTSIARRRLATEPLRVVLPVGGLVARVGERVGLDVSVTNECDGPRTVSLLYDAIDAPSALGFSALPVVGPTSTSTTTTTLPPTGPAGCEEQGQLAVSQRLLCRLDTIAALLRAQPAPALGGLRLRRRLFLRLERAQALVAAAAPAGPRGALAARTVRATRHFDRLVRRAERAGRIDSALAADLRRLVGEVVEELKALRTAGR